jgi:NADPH:quinone reductase
MRAVAFEKPLPITDQNAFIDIDLPVPQPQGRQLLVEVKAVSVNPVDVKIRASRTPQGGKPEVIGWDAAGIVRAVGADAALFNPGDRVYYAGSIDRPGSNSEFQLVDERIVGHMPQSLDFPAAAALPLTAITAYEGLFDRLRINDPVGGAANAIVIIGGAGGVGSIAIQLVRALSNVTVIATASRPETAEWAKALGAHHVIDHSRPMAAQVQDLQIGAPGFVFSTNGTGAHTPEIADLIAPQGRLGLIDNEGSFDIIPFMRKSLSVHWELMFTRPLFDTVDIEKQHALLNHVAELVDAGKIRSTLTQIVGPINAENLKRAHAMIETGKTKGKLVLAGF